MGLSCYRLTERKHGEISAHNHRNQQCTTEKAVWTALPGREAPATVDDNDDSVAVDLQSIKGQQGQFKSHQFPYVRVT